MPGGPAADRVGLGGRGKAQEVAGRSAQRGGGVGNSTMDGRWTIHREYKIQNKEIS